MKELTTEEKAKRYDEALERARAINNGESVDIEAGTTTCEYIFSELRDFKDERIRKEIIAFIKENYSSAKPWIAWLEKQGEKKSDVRYKYLEELLAADDIYQMAMDDDMVQEAKTKAINALSELEISKPLGLEKQSDTSVFYLPEISIKDAVEVTSRMQYIEDDMKPIADFIMDYAYWDLHKDVWNQPTLTVPLFRVLDALIQRGKPYGDCSQNIAKQDEQKPYGQRKECSNCQFNYAGECKGSCAMKRDEQIHADNIVPKFHKGEWVVTDKGDTIQIDSANPGYYTLSNGMEFCTSYVDKYWHLWTIQDAKDGDVLVACDESVFIYSGSTDIYAQSYIALSKYGDLDTKSGNWGDKNWVYPATKEQRDLLFTKMREAGYEWDFDEKELKKIDTYCQDNCKGFQETGKCFADGDCKAKREAKQKPAEWSEEDERTYRGLHNLIYSTPYCNSRKKLSDFLKSLKDRVQPKQEWAEEDEKCIRLSIDIIDSALRAGFCVQLDRDRCIDWLKSIKQRYTWKPSEEQITWLYRAADDASKDSRMKQILNELLSDLKKLKGE